MSDIHTFFPSGETAPSGPGPTHSWGFYITHNDTSQSAGSLCTSDRPVAETSTWQHNPRPGGGIRTRDPSTRAAADPRLRPLSHWHRLYRQNEPIAIYECTRQNEKCLRQLSPVRTQTLPHETPDRLMWLLDDLSRRRPNCDARPSHATLWSTRQAMYAQRNNEARSRIIVAMIQQYVLHICLCACSCVHVALWRHLWPLWLHHSFRHYLINDAIFRKKLLTIKCVFWFSLQLLSITFLSLKRS